MGIIHLGIGQGLFKMHGRHWAPRLLSRWSTWWALELYLHYTRRWTSMVLVRKAVEQTAMR